MAWFRLHTDIIDDEKIKKMDEKTFKIFIFLLAYAAELNQKGEIKKSISEIEWRLRIKQKQLEKSIKILVDLKILTQNSEGFEIVNFQKRQFDASYLRVTKHREMKRKRNAECNVTKALHSRARITDTDINTPPISPPGGNGVISLLDENESIPIAEILQDLVDKTGLKIRFDNPDTLRQIRALWRDGYVLEDFKHVHAVKAAEWGGDPAKRQWLHPNTLYKRGKFEVYRNQEKEIIEGQEPWRF